jgi:hypothetical protein
MSSESVSLPQRNARTNLGMLKRFFMERIEYEDGMIVCGLHEKDSSCPRKFKSALTYSLHIQDWAYFTYAPELRCQVS